jgi:hypothetical protein
MSRGCLAELNKAEIGEPGWTAFWNSLSCCAIVDVMFLTFVVVVDGTLDDDADNGIDVDGGN